ncbi:MAG: (d)CMP kinase [Capnocytophaga sp.]|nr:(d)CMP kinase [Capnocytophaga sp.]
MRKQIIIAIDGFSSTGKSTIAKIVAQQLGYVYVDTGAMYRTVALLALNNGLVCETTADEQAILEKLKKSHMEFRFNSALGYSEMFLDGNNVEKEIRGIAVANQVSNVAKLSGVRSYLVDLQRKMGEKRGVVMDGRDIGTVVFPDAELKIYMTASEQERAQRRYNELVAKGENVSFEQISENVKRRDFLDTTREESPLRKAPDAVEIDNTHLTISEQVGRIIALAEEKSI